MIPLHTHRMAKTEKTSNKSVRKDVEPLELSHITGEWEGDHYNL